MNDRSQPVTIAMDRREWDFIVQSLERYARLLQAIAASDVTRYTQSAAKVGDAAQNLREVIGTQQSSASLWSDAENTAIVDAYFLMLDRELAGEEYVKADFRKQLQEGLLAQRSRGSIEFKLRNVSAVLEDYEMLWIEGYKPAFRYQTRLEQIVLAKLEARGVDIPEKDVREPL